MPHITVAMFPGRDAAAKTNLALAVRETVSKELGIGPEYVSVSVEDIEPERWEEAMRRIPAGTVFVEPGAPKNADGAKGGKQV
ncbi:tautomerase family protein [Christensenella tenuis]|jgi:4-oxalocrotonate tautomerase|uniref:Tautomerase family protein n=1 Tax=Christensenella tenuis TaxID=2763033 RepID=A0ABR7EF04_9FIRM|nr:tautomerase family protein [Christensenella tenuis]MBC5648362.1 tautomerase family protein [Christensenella tenuis]